jgi:hypothetical protein
VHRALIVLGMSEGNEAFLNKLATYYRPVLPSMLTKKVLSSFKCIVLALESCVTKLLANVTTDNALFSSRQSVA